MNFDELIYHLSNQMFPHFFPGKILSLIEHAVHDAPVHLFLLQHVFRPGGAIAYMIICIICIRG